MTYVTSGIILINTPFREHDKLVNIYTQDYGKVTTLARGTLKIKSKLCGHIEPMVFTNVMIANGRHFDILAQSTAHDVFSNVRRDLKKTIFAQVALESVNTLTKHDLKDPAVFRHLVSFLRFLDTENDENYLALGRKNQQYIIYLAYIFLFRLIGLLGHAPDLHKCVTCKRPLKEHELSAFSFEHSALICHGCYDGDNNMPILSKEEVIILQAWRDADFTRGNFTVIGTKTLNAVVLTSLRHLMDGRDLNSLILLERYSTIRL